MADRFATYALQELVTQRFYLAVDLLHQLDRQMVWDVLVLPFAHVAQQTEVSRIFRELQLEIRVELSLFDAKLGQQRP